MAKRKLSIQQRRRIAEKRRLDLENFNTRDPQVASQGEFEEGLVVGNFGVKVDLLPMGAPPCQTLRCHIRSNIDSLVAGDRVLWRRQGSHGVVESVVARSSLLSRPDQRGKLRPVAANVDQLGIVFAAEPEPHQNLIDRYLVAAEHLGIRPLLVANKADLFKLQPSKIQILIDLYTHLGYPLIVVSSLSATGLDTLHNALKDHTTVLVGQSGVGKSTLVNLIHPQALAATQDLSAQAKGRHTTTAARLYLLQTGGYLIDSPGIREFGLWHLPTNEVAAGFIEFHPFLGHCKFRDCTHFAEPGCALCIAEAEGQISFARLQSYRKIVRDLQAVG